MANKEKSKQPEKVNEQTENYDSNGTDLSIPYPFIDERFEIINGVRYEFSPSPTLLHQILVTELNRSISQTCRLNGIIVVAPMDVHLDDKNILQPDVIFIANETTHIIKNNGIYGAPDLVVEILSPSTSTNDKIRKKAQYEQFGVKEYWIVDPIHHIIDQFMLADDKYYLHATYAPGNILNSTLFSCISIELTALFDSIKRFE